MKKKISITMCVFCVFSLSECFGQTDSLNKIEVKLGVFYNTHLNYYGRSDSLESAGFFPMAEIWFRKKFYVNAAPVFVNNISESFQYAGTVATAGYQSLSGDKKWIENIYMAKPFYKPGSEIVQSALKAQFSFSFTRLSKIIDINAGADLKWSDQADFGVTGGIDHIFKQQLGVHSILVIAPSLYVYAGTQRFSTTGKQAIGPLLFPIQTADEGSQEKHFNLLSYELSSPIIFMRGRLQLLATPAFVTPKNFVPTSNSEEARPIFYATLGSKITL